VWLQENPKLGIVESPKAMRDGVEPSTCRRWIGEVERRQKAQPVIEEGLGGIRYEEMVQENEDSRWQRVGDRFYTRGVVQRRSKLRYDGRNMLLGRKDNRKVQRSFIHCKALVSRSKSCGQRTNLQL
jgi:hypothetical protein